MFCFLQWEYLTITRTWCQRQWLIAQVVEQVMHIQGSSVQSPSLRNGNNTTNTTNNTTLQLMQQFIVTKVNGGSVVGIDKFILKMHLPIRDGLRAVHNDQLVY